MRLAKASIGRKLLFSFSAMALLVLLSALIGVLGFSLVAKTERDVVNNAIPSMIERAKSLSSVIKSLLLYRLFLTPKMSKNTKPLAEGFLAIRNVAHSYPATGRRGV